MSRLRQWAKAAVVRARHVRGESVRRRLKQPDGSLPASLWDLDVNAVGHLAVCGHDTVQLANRYGTPLHVVSRPRLHKDFMRFVTAFRRGWPNVEVGYSYKTNPLPGVIRELHSWGAWAEVISQFELWLALELGVPAERIIYNGPAKSDDGLHLAIGHGVRLINVDSLSEIERVDAIAMSLGKTQSVGMRLVTSVGWSGQFGLSIADGEADTALEHLLASRNIDPCGLHIHLGTGIKDVSTYLQAIREVLEFARRAQRERGVHIRYLDFGGGFGVPTVRPVHIWDERLMALGYPPEPVDPALAPSIETVADAILRIMGDWSEAEVAPHPMLLFEPGRAITSSAQLLLLRVLAVKPGSDGARRVILDGGKNIALPTGYELHELLPASAMRSHYAAPHHFYGPLCHPGDVLARWKKFPNVERGDIVALMDAGAYFVPNQMNFSNPRAAAIMVDASHDWLIRERESFQNIVQLDRTIATPAAVERSQLAS